jgi:hypothetical protein
MCLAGGCGGSSTAKKTTPAVVTPRATALSSASDNGMATKPANVILTAVKKAVQRSTSVHYHGEFTDGHEKLKLDMHVGTDSSQGEMTLPIKGTPVDLNIITSQGKTYIKSRSLWQIAGGAAMAQLVGDRWGIMPASWDSEFKSFTTISGIADDMLNPGGPIRRGKPAVIKGQPVVALVDSDNSSMYVATTGDPLTVRVSPPPAESKPGEYVDFTEWNAPLTITPPADPVDLSKPTTSSN